jgi:hypothetical protein
MSQIALYQSILQKLGQLSPNDLAALDTFLSSLIKQKPKKKPKKSISHLAGAWSKWEETPFQDFLLNTQQTRENLFANHNLDL